MTITLIVPPSMTSLFLEVPPFKKRMRRQGIDRIQRSAEWLLCHYFRVPPPLPYAAIHGAREGMVPAGNDQWWLRVDPVHCQAGMCEVVLHHPEILSITHIEAQSLIAALNPLLNDYGFHIHMKNPKAWYISMPISPEVKSVPLEKVVGTCLSECPLEGKNATFWEALLTEIQMVLFSHPVNARRRIEGKLAVNHLWLWGEGRYPKVNPRMQHYFGEEPLGVGLATIGEIYSGRVSDFLKSPCENSLVDLSCEDPAILPSLFALMKETDEDIVMHFVDQFSAALPSMAKQSCWKKIISVWKRNGKNNHATESDISPACEQQISS